MAFEGHPGCRAVRYRPGWRRLSRAAHGQALAAAVAFIAGPDSGRINAQTICANGGMV